MKLNIRNQLLLAFGVLLLLAALIGWVGINQAGQINQRALELYSDDLVNTGSVAELGQLAMQDRAAELEHLLADTPAGKTEFQNEIGDIDAQVNSAFQSLKAG